MKWLILFLAIACGRHEEPLFQDLRDFDGDQILNYQEFGSDKIIANVESPGEVKGIIRFLANQLHEVPFSNSIDKKNLITQLLIANEDYMKETPVFSEWMNLHLKTSEPVILKAKQYPIQLTFESSTGQLDKLAIFSGKEFVVLGTWSPFMKIELSSETLNDLLSGKKILAVKRKLKRSPLFEKETEETIKEKTVRLYFFDGKMARISYISNQMMMKEILEVFDIKKSQTVDIKSLIFNFLSDEVRWFQRELRNGDKILIKSSEIELQKELLKGFEYKKSLISRENGFQAKTSYLFNKKGAKIFLRIRNVVRKDRIFKDRIVSKVHGRYGSARLGDWSPGYNCDHYLREIADETVSFPDQEELIDHLILSPRIAGENLLPTESLEEKFGEEGAFWDGSLIATEENLIMGIESSPLYTFTVTGEIKNSCRDDITAGNRFASYSTHPEGKFSFVLESYVEKIP
jgi:hypothetical protein